jgi:hypothetical protein
MWCYPKYEYFTGPMEQTLYYVQGCDEIKQSTVVGRIVLEEELPLELHLSQLSHDLSEEDPGGGVEGFLESTHAYTLLYPTFKQIICLTTGDRKLASWSYESLKILHKKLLMKLAPAPNSDRTTEENKFRSSNLELDFNAKSNKRIRPRGESGNKKKTKNYIVKPFMILFYFVSNTSNALGGVASYWSKNIIVVSDSNRYSKNIIVVTDSHR